MKKKYYITTPLYYVNAKPHIGHAYTTVAADAAARFNRLMGNDVFFLTGTDEHGQKVVKAAAEAGLTPQEFTDRISATFRETWSALGISHDYFIRTTEEKHKAAVKAVWLELQKRGEIYETQYTAWYCIHCERFLTEFEAGQEGGPVCPDCKRLTDQKISETNFFFKMSKHQQWLVEHLKKNPGSVLPESRRNEVLGFLHTEKLEDLCVSRPKARLSWGIECPLNPDYVTYVWFDALINYISACGYPKLDKWWPADVHLVGKDILRHHAVFWPIILKALGLEQPKLVFAHGWWVQGKEKMSKSRGNVIDPIEVISKYGVDAFRYFLLRETTFGQDGVFSEEAFIERYNTDLANDLGNLLHRTLTMCEKYFDGIVPNFPQLPDSSSVIEDAGGLKTDAYMMQEKIERSLTVLAFGDALFAIWSVISKANKYIEKTAPWSLWKEQRKEELKYAVITLIEVLKLVCQYLYPFMPTTAKSMWTQLGIKASIDVLHKQSMGWEYTLFGTKIAKGSPLFPKIISETDKVRET